MSNPLLIGVTIVTCILVVSYIYFWIIMGHARLNKHIDRSDVTNLEIVNLVSHAKRTDKPYMFTIQITTKGGSSHVVQRGIEYVVKATKKYPVLKDLVIVEVITEDNNDKILLDNQFRHSDIPVNVYILPKDYTTPKRTELKARALHYMVEMHRKHPINGYVVHYDEESVLTEDNLARLVRNLIRTPMGISEGSISYPLEYRDSHPLCRTMEANRPFGCHECYLMMTNPAPLHLHGSNLVVQEKLENQIGWDIGRLGDNPLIAEDLVFGLMFFLKFGKDSFGWHGVEMIEQPPFTPKAAYKQRERWVMGALQGVAHVRSLDGWKQIPLFERIKIQTIIKLRVATYALGLPVSVLSLTLLLFYVGYDISSTVIGYGHIQGFSLLAIPGLILWLGGTQIGLAQNLRYTDMTRIQKVVEHGKVLLLTPFSGLLDTAGPVVASFKWISGVRGIKWVPTPKLVGQEFGDNELVKEVA